MYDVIIVGAGPAGLTAATNTAHRSLKTLVIEQCERPGGQPLIFYPDKIIKDHPGFPIGVLAKEFARMLELQAQNAGAKIKCNEEVLTILPDKEVFIVKTTNEAYKARRVILCTGSLNIPRKIPALDKYRNKGVFYKVGDVKRFKDQQVVVVGGGDNAFDTAIQLSAIANSVRVVIDQEYPKAKDNSVKLAEKKGVKVYTKCQVTDIIENKDGRIDRVKIKDMRINEFFELRTDVVFSAIGFSPIVDFLEGNNLDHEKDGSVKIGGDFQTSVPGIFAAGDLTGEVKLIAVACAEGIEAAINAFSSIKKPYWIK